MENPRENPIQPRLPRRAILAGAAASAVLVLPGCATLGSLSLVDVIRRLLERSTQNALARLMAPGGFWDNQLARLDLPGAFGGRGLVLQTLLAAAPVRNRLQREMNRVAEGGARRAAPIVADAVRAIGIDNAKALISGGPTAATDLLRTAMNGRLVEEMIPALGEGLRAASDPIVGQAIAALTGIDLTGVARSLSEKAENSIWAEIGREEGSIRANPQATGDPLLIAAFKVA